MGLMGTLAKVAIGYAAARGVDKLAGGQGLGGLLGGGAQVKATDPNAAAQAQVGQMMAGQGAEDGNPLSDMMSKMQESGLGGMMGGGDGAGNPMADMMAKMQEGGLGGLMGAMGGGAGGAGNPMADMMAKMQEGGLGALMGGGQAADTGDKEGGLLSSMGGGAGLAGILAAAGGAAAAAQGQGAGALLDAFNTRETAPDAEAIAALMLRAMIQAAKADGGIDESEKAKILDTLGDDADAEDIAFVQDQLAAPVDVEALAADTPEAQAAQVYSASLMTIRVDTQAEAQYLDALAKAMGLDETMVNTLHMQMGIQPLYA